MEATLPTSMLRNFNVELRVRTGAYGTHERETYQVYAMTASGAVREAKEICETLHRHEKKKLGLLYFGVEPKFVSVNLA